jgi:serine/threonine protein kinase
MPCTPIHSHTARLPCPVPPASSYMSPELFIQDSVSPALDIYSLGVVSEWRPPLPPARQQARNLHLQAPPPPPTPLSLHVPPTFSPHKQACACLTRSVSDVGWQGPVC